MHRDADEVDTHFLQFFKVIFVPMSLVIDFIGIGDGHAAEQDGVAVGIYKFISLHPDARRLVGQMSAEGSVVRAIVPPLMVVICLIGLLGIDVREPEQRETEAGKKVE